MNRPRSISLVLLLLSSCLADAATRDVNEIGMRALRNGRISSTKPARDFTQIPADANYAPDRLLVRFALNPDGTVPSPAAKGRILALAGGATIEHEFHLVPGLTLIKLPAGQKVDQNVLRRFNNRPEILYGEPDYAVKAATMPNDQYFGNQWALYNTNNYPYIHAPEAWDNNTGSQEIVVAVTDTGVNYNHADLSANMWTNQYGYHGYDYVNLDSDPMDDYGHGTHVAGILGAVGNNGVGITGVCWQVRIMALKFLDNTGNGWASNGLAAIEYATEMGAHVINCSWRYYTGDPLFNVSPATVEDVINAAGEANIVVAAAAGNESLSIDGTPAYPASSNCDNIISVAATNNSGSRASFSNYGATNVDLFAPGVGIYSCYGSGYAYMDGTSMAAPHVAGACALLLSINPSLSYQQIKAIILDNVDVYAGLSGLCVTSGLLNLNNAVLDDRTTDISQAHVWAFTGTPQQRDPVAWIDVRGDLVLAGTLETGSACNRTNFRGFKIRNQGGSVVGLLDANTGDMLITGQCYENWTPGTPTNSVFNVKAPDGTVLAYIDNAGNLRLKGELFESI